MKSSRYIKNTMRKAREVQSRYNTIGSPSTQNVRNPLPMHKLVLSVLPVLPHPNHVIEVEKSMKVSAMGRNFTRKVMSNEFASTALGESFWQEHALSVDDVIAALESKGYIVNTRVSVTVALNTFKHAGIVRSLRCVRPYSGEGTRENVSYCRYFVVQS